MKKNPPTCRPLKKMITIKGLNPLFPASTASVCAITNARGRHYIGALDKIVTVSVQPVESFDAGGLPNKKSKWAVFITDHNRMGDKHTGGRIIRSKTMRGTGVMPPNEKVGFPKAFSHMSASISD